MQTHAVLHNRALDGVDVGRRGHREAKVDQRDEKVKAPEDPANDLSVDLHAAAGAYFKKLAALSNWAELVCPELMLATKILRSALQGAEARTISRSGQAGPHRHSKFKPTANEKKAHFERPMKTRFRGRSIRHGTQDVPRLS